MYTWTASCLLVGVGVVCVPVYIYLPVCLPVCVPVFTCVCFPRCKVNQPVPFYQKEVFFNDGEAFVPNYVHLEPIPKSKYCVTKVRSGGDGGGGSGSIVIIIVIHLFPFIYFD